VDDVAALPVSVRERLERLAPDQRAAATAPPGPILCVAPAGSGKTTTLVARICWLIATGVHPEEITAITFNKRAQEELAERLAAATEPLGPAPGAVRVRTFHALGREILLAAGHVFQLIDREALLRELWPSSRAADRRRLDDAFSRLKLDLRVDADVVATDPGAGPIARAYVAYESTLRERAAIDFDGLVVEALRLLAADADALRYWRARCTHLLVDEVQDLDRSQLDLARLLAAPENRIFLVGDDDQSIYGWRLADVRRVISLVDSLPGLRRVDLVTNYRCPETVVERAVRLVEHNQERFRKRIVARPGASGRIVLAADSSDESVRVGRLLDGWPDDDRTRAILARTNRELLSAAAVAVDRRRSFRAARLALLVESPDLDALLDRVEPDGPHAPPLLVRLGRVRGEVRWDHYADDDGEVGDRPAITELATALLGWGARFRDLSSLRAAIQHVRTGITRLRRDDATLTLATVHGTKGLEWDHVAVIGLEASRFPSARSVDEAADPVRALEEERRLAYVAWTRARVSLTLVYDPATPSRFLLEAFDASELGVDPADAATIDV
jgi:superfamily I DNA/RNA helicase